MRVGGSAVGRGEGGVGLLSRRGPCRLVVMLPLISVLPLASVAAAAAAAATISAARTAA